MSILSKDSIKGAEVLRDTWGIPHIRAQSETDAFAALG
jgi:acyl-homoserine lactone acylase PvdQ